MDAKLLKTLMKKKPEEATNTRLQSLRLPRDLSLGGTKPKKVFAPNVNVVRNKDKAKEVIKNLDRKRKERTKNEPRTRTFGDGQRFVQSSGIFSDGSAEQRRSTQYSERSYSGKTENDPSIGISVPTYKKYKWMVDKQKEEGVLDELVNREDDDDDKMHLMPVMWKNPESKVFPSAVKIENKMNGDATGYGEVDPDRMVPYFHKIEREGETKLALIKLPDSLAGKGLSDDPSVKKIFDYPLNVMLEGKIGTLQVRSSGRMYMQIGHVKYLLESTDFFSSNEVIASYSEPRFEKDSPQFAVLGNVEERFVVNPIWKYLLKS
ncbi:hypothetical protein HHI36_023393 [Cryptolaemus montrouzieri]|uniref:DNA-directed RNA polymerase III subunit RPC4 n=1 Tax=Cryptolaemus montrouzieri TaxID=559131 RepID=A0ABD2PH02_9CUCU